MTGTVIWFTGLPSSGKSTLANRVADALKERGIKPCLLDGDEVRAAIVPPHRYDSKSREAFYHTLGNLAVLLANQGLIVLVPATAHRRSFRDRVRATTPKFIEVHLDVSLEDVRRRDTKGLYRATENGKGSDVPGADLKYEPPLQPEVIASGGNDFVAVSSILERIR